MFQVELLSMGDGQSYEHATVCEEEDLDRLNIPKPFEKWTACFFANGKCIVCHHYKIAVLHLDRHQRSGPGCVHVERVLFAGDISYAPALILPVEVWRSHGVPEYFVKEYGFEGQFVISCQQGTIITADQNVASIIVQYPKHQGITRSKHVQESVGKTVKQTAVPNTVHSKIERRKR